MELSNSNVGGFDSEGVIFLFELAGEVATQGKPSSTNIALLEITNTVPLLLKSIAALKFSV